MMSTKASMARFTAVPIAPEELSMFWSAGDSFCRKMTAPSAARTGSFRATALISVTASLIRVMAGSERQPKDPLRKRGPNAQVCLLVALLIVVNNNLGLAFQDAKLQHLSTVRTGLHHAMQEPIGNAPLLLVA